MRPVFPEVIKSKESVRNSYSQEEPEESEQLSVIRPRWGPGAEEE